MGKPGIRRRGYRKSFTGCNVCKASHVRCDEAKPACTRCLRLHRECDFRSIPRKAKKPAKQTLQRLQSATQDTPERHVTTIKSAKQTLRKGATGVPQRTREITELTKLAVVDLLAPRIEPDIIANCDRPSNRFLVATHQVVLELSDYEHIFLCCIRGCFTPHNTFASTWILHNTAFGDAEIMKRYLSGAIKRYNKRYGHELTTEQALTAFNLLLSRTEKRMMELLLPNAA